jgi:predicted NAD/FAD-dependent oxidoreductase
MTAATTTTSTVVVVGAGAAGLSAARRLAGDHRVMVIDKGRGVGGRMATRRLGSATFDHGAQFVTTHSPEFADEVERWCDAGVARPWYRGRVGASGVQDHDGHVRYCGATSMNAVAKHLADGLDVRRSTRATAIEAQGERWRIPLDTGDELLADAVVLTAPVPQSLELLAAGSTVLGDEDRRALERIEYEPCLAVMACLDSPAELPDPGAVAPTAGPLEWIADNHAKGISAVPALTLHAGAEASSALWDVPDELVVAELVAAAGVAIGRALVATDSSVQRWRYARPSVSHPERCLAASGLPPLVLAGDAFGEPKVEGAVRSGSAAAAALRQAIDGQP